MNLLTKEQLKYKLQLVTPLVAFMVFYMIWFHALEIRSNVVFHIVHCPLDDLIPFCPYFIIPYLSWFLFVPAIVLFILLTDEAAYHRLSIVLMAGMLFFLIFSTLYPTILYLRPSVMPNNGIFCRAVARLYSTDTPTNVSPSVHVYNTLAVLWSLLESRKKPARNRMLRIVSICIAVLIILSTVFLRQHSVIDLLEAGALFLAVTWTVSHFSASAPGKQHLSLADAGEDVVS